MDFSKLLLLAYFSVLAAGMNAAAPYDPASKGDSVQSILGELYRKRPDLVGFIPETQRYYLFVARAEAIPEKDYPRLQAAFLYDIGNQCRFYGERYLADWRVLASKAARETCWGTSYLCNRAFNYFGIRHNAKPWMCESFYFCQKLTRNDPYPAEFAMFPTFEASLWMFIHTMYSGHFLERLPDGGALVAEAIEFERMNQIHYWERTAYGINYQEQLKGLPYTAEELIYTWSGHPINNLCVDCNRATDLDWVARLEMAAQRY